jgi:membrane-bound serine protease (ClpP class)
MIRRRSDRRLARLIGFAVILILGAWALRAQDAGREAVVLRLDGAVTPASADYLVRGIGEAAADGAGLVVIAMDTPGGLVTSMREIIGAILESPVPVATYVTPSGARAASAGTYILYASHVAAMAPSTNLGAATPIALGGGAGDDDGQSAGEAKAINDAVAYIRGLAELRDRNGDWAEAAVREAESLTASPRRPKG